MLVSGGVKPLIAAICVCLAGSAAYAEDVIAYQADGDADARAPDARVAALDEAFGKAVSQALGDLLEPDVRRQSKSVLDRELVGRARLWVAKFTVTKEAVADDRKQLSVTVRVDRDKMRARLVELNIALKGAGDAPAANAPGALVLLRVATLEGVQTSFGPGSTSDLTGLAALSSVLRGASFAVVKPPLAPAARTDSELPLDDDTANALADEARADTVVIASALAGPPVPLRGVDADGVLVTARVRIIDRKARKLLGQASVVTAARGANAGVVARAIDRALVSAAGDVLPAPAQRLSQAPTYTAGSAPIGEPGVVLVRLARATPWPVVQAELRHLVGARGVSRATLRHVSPAGWVIGVATGEPIERVAAIVKRPPAADTAVTVKIVGEIVEATLSSASQTP